MNALQHYQQAEMHLEMARGATNPTTTTAHVGMAQVHAHLAAVALMVDMAPTVALDGGIVSTIAPAGLGTHAVAEWSEVLSS